MPNPIRIAMAGLGQWGPNLLRNLLDNEDCRVVALCDRDPARLREFSARIPDVVTYPDVTDIPRDAIDAVVLATPAGLHETHVRHAIAQSWDVLVEKPLAMTSNASAALVELARTSDRILMAGHTFLFNPAVRRVRDEIAKGTLGKVQLILAQRMSLGRIRTDCNALWNLAPHDVSILLYWLGEMPTSVTARGIAFHPGHTQEDIALCHLEFPGPTMASIQVSWMNPTKVRQMTVCGSERMLVYDDVDTAHPLTLYHRRVEEVRDAPEGSLERFHLEVRNGPHEELPIDPAEPLALEIAHFLDCIRTRREPIGSGADALCITRVLEACDLSMKQGGVPVRL